MKKPINFIVHSRRSIQSYTSEKKYIVISVRDPNSKKAELSPDKNRLDTLFLPFHDWDGEHLRRMITSETKPLTQYVFFSADMAESIINFVEKYLDDIEIVICQCEAGISRSAAIAGALSKIINGNDDYFFQRYLPNRLVYSQIIRYKMFHQYYDKNNNIDF